MSNFNRCTKCGAYDFLDTHKCYPFQVLYPDYFDEEWETMYGTSAENVVEKLAIKINSDDPVFETNIFESPVKVKDCNGLITSFKCTACISIDYHVDVIKG